MRSDNYSFWMGGRYARSLVEVSGDLSQLADGNFWAVNISFEGDIRLARFAEVNDAPFPATIESGSTANAKWSSSMDESAYCIYVSTIRSAIADGLVYQANACRILSRFFSGDDLASLFSQILRENPAPYASYLSIPEIEIASASPELFMRREGSLITTSPIKGTQTLSEHGFGEKDKSENIMIVDLMRNDFGQICEPGSINAAQILRSEDHPGLRHLVSDVTGLLRDGISWTEIAKALLPAGSISGAPKSSALKIIKDNEPVVRGPYCGILGWVQGDRAELSVAIRTFWSNRDSQLHFGTGAGITWGSDPSDEWEETQLKASRLISIAGGELR
jgi:para-aminobenzoate synthetase component I